MLGVDPVGFDQQLARRVVPLKFLVPGTVFLIAFSVVPIVYNVNVAFTNWSTGHILVKNITVIGLQSSDYREKEPEALRAAYDALLGQYSKGLIKAHVSAAYPLADAAEALEEIRSGRVKGKVVLTTETR